MHLNGLVNGDGEISICGNLQTSGSNFLLDSLERG